MAEHDDLQTARQHLWLALEPLGTGQVLRRNSLIYTPHQPAHTLYLLRSGQVSLQLIGPHDRSLTVRVAEAGDIFGLNVLTGRETYEATAEALRSGRLVAVPRRALNQALAAQPQLANAMLTLIAEEQRLLGRRIEEVAFKSVPARLASVLVDMAESAGADAPQPALPRRTHQQLAQMINAYRETVTKVINQFRDARLLDVDRSEITILNLSGLRELAQS